jgi:exosome complex RNA-binding protein Csl4
LPGDHLSSAEESEAADNTYSEKDEVYSAAFGENQSVPGRAAVKTKRPSLAQPTVGMEVYCVITKSSLNKAVAGCISVAEAEGGGRGMEIDAVLPVTAIREGYVDRVRDEVKIGDLIKARIEKVMKTGIDITMKPAGCGVISAFCPRCRLRMDLKESIFICSSCGWKERRKLPLKEGETPPEAPPRREFRGRDRRPPRRDFRKGGY